MSDLTAGRARSFVWVFVLLVAGALLLRVPAIVEPFGPDQGIYATIAWAMRRGFRLYRDLFEQKPPGLFLTYWLGFGLLGERSSSVFWIDYVAAAITTLALWNLGRQLISARFGWLAAAVYAVGTLPAARQSVGGMLERSITESFICPVVACAALATATAMRRSTLRQAQGLPLRQARGVAGDRWSVVAGLLSGLALVYKPMTVVYWIAFIAWVWFMTGFQFASRFALLSAAGAVVVPTIVLTWMWATGILPDAWVAMAEYNRAYLTVKNESLFTLVDRLAHEVFRRMKTDEIWALGMLGAFAALAAWRWRRSTAASVASLGVLWISAAGLAILLNGPRMFLTYFMPPLVPLCLLTAWLLDQSFAPGRRWRVASIVGVLAFTLLMLYRSGSVNRAIRSTSADVRQLFGQTDREQYLRGFESRASSKAFSAADNELLAAYLHAHTNPDERLFIFGMTASAYFLSERLPASRFLFVYPAVSNMIDRPDFRVETLAASLARSQPRYIVLQRHNGDSFSGWKAIDSFESPPMVELLRNYQHETDIGDFSLYRRN